MSESTYILERTEAEERRLQRQAAILDPFTQRLFAAAGIGSGMAVLDLGSGAGDVAMIVAEMVGPTGRVVSVDIDPTILQTAHRRATAAGHRNITFVAGDIREMPLEGDYDAIVGRLILCHLSDPAAVLRHLAPHLRMGGVAVFHDLDMTVPATAYPPVDLTRAIFRWLEQALAFAGIGTGMGMQLHRIFSDAGLGAPQITVDALAGGSPAFLEEFTAYVTDTARALLPLIVKGGIATEQEVGIETLIDRWRDELRTHGCMVRSGLYMGGWARKA